MLCPPRHALPSLSRARRQPSTGLAGSRASLWQPRKGQRLTCSPRTSQEQLPRASCVSQTSSSTSPAPASARLAAGRAQPQAPRAPRLLPPAAPWQVLSSESRRCHLQGQEPFRRVPPKDPSVQPTTLLPCLQPPPSLGQSQGFLPLQALLPPSNFYSSLPGASAAQPTPKQKGPKGDTPSGTPESSGTSAGCRTADLQKPRKGAAERPALAQPQRWACRETRWGGSLPCTSREGGQACSL